MDKLGKIIEKRLNQHKIGDSARASEVLHNANQFLSKKLQCNDNEVRAVKIKNGILTIGVLNSIWGQEVWGIISLLLKKLQNDFGETYVKKITTYTFA